MSLSTKRGVAVELEGPDFGVDEVLGLGGDPEGGGVGARQPFVVGRSVQSTLVGVGEAPVRSFLLQPPRIWRRG